MGDTRRMMYSYWRKGRKINHIVWSGDKDKTLCSLKVFPDNRKSTSINHTDMCKKCLNIYNGAMERYG
jgi:hypothetical protein